MCGPRPLFFRGGPETPKAGHPGYARICASLASPETQPTGCVSLFRADSCLGSASRSEVRGHASSHRKCIHFCSPCTGAQPCGGPGFSGGDPWPTQRLGQSRSSAPRPAARGSETEGAGCAGLRMPSGQDPLPGAYRRSVPGIISRWPARIIDFLADTSCILKGFFLPGIFGRFQQWRSSYLAHRSASRHSF